MLQVGSQVDVRGLDGEVVTCTIRALRAKGGQGYVYTLRGPEDDTYVLKVPGPQGLVGNEVERRILQTIPPHPNIVRLLGTADIQGVSCPVLSWGHENPFLRLNDPSLEQSLKPFRGISPRTALPATTAIEMIYEVLLALEHMHKLGFVHGDVKSANVLIEIDTEEPKLSNTDYFAAVQQRSYRTILVDFGSTRSTAFLENMDVKDEALAPSEFTPLYAPPEVFRGVGKSKGGPSVDAYQVGLLLYQWISGYPPYDHVLPNLVREGYTNELVDVKKREAEGSVRPFDPVKLRSARQHDVVFAEAFAAQRLRDRFFEDVQTILDFATNPDPQARPSLTTLREEVRRLFELEEPRGVGEGILLVTAWNPKWHLTRQNRLSEAGRVDASAEATGTVTPSPRRGESERLSPAHRPTRAKLSDRLSRQELEARVDGPEPPAPPAAAPPEPAGLGATARYQPTGVRETPSETGRLRQGGLGPETGRHSGPPGSAPAGEGGGRRVALVDDDKVALAMLARSLRRRGFLVRTFQDPESALDAISHDQPDAVIVDMHMPGMTGLDMIREWERRLHGRPFAIMCLTAVEDESAFREAYRHGVSDYLIKPVTEAELAVKLDKAIASHHERERDSLPRELSGFDLMDETRRGETAIVFQAADTWGRFPDVVKSLKVIRPEAVGSAEALLKLRREIDVLARCNHPGIPRLHLSGLWGRLLYYVTDEAPSQSLGELVREAGRFDEGKTLWLLDQVSSALEHLHGEGVLVSELTPESLGVLEAERLVITELGYARTLDTGAERGDEPMPPNSRYLAPEWLLDVPQPDPRSDLYALGVVALEAFTGRPAPRLRRGPVDFRGGTSEMSPNLASLVAGLCSPDPDGRPESAGALLDRISRLRS